MRSNTSMKTLASAFSPAFVGDSRKRSRSHGRAQATTRTSTSAASIRVLSHVALLSTVWMISPVCAFSILTSKGGNLRRPSLALQARKIETAERPATADFVTRVLPRSRTPTEQRRRALNAMNSSGRNSSGNINNNNLSAVLESPTATLDADALEKLLAASPETLLYATAQMASSSASKKNAPSRPKGRPAYVPGAMNYDTLIKFRERQELLQQQSELASTIAPYASPALSHDKRETAAAVSVEVKEYDTSTDSSSSTQTKKRIGGVKGVHNKASSVVDEEPTKKQRKRVVKSLPQPRNRSAEEKAQSATNSNRIIKGSSLDLHKYYRTELLSVDEEYSLGMKVQFMIKCEQVHEGLSAHLMRIPSIQEWAEACGFTDPDPAYVPMEGDEQIRPAGSDALFEVTDTNMFIGNGLATAGPGRGRGRAKMPPPLQLQEFYDDSEDQAALRANKRKPKEQQQRVKRKCLPVNRGTVSDFIDKMLTAREAKQQMVQSNMRLVVSIARKYANVGVSLQDLVQEGSLGLSRAAEKFEPAKGFKFSTYASWWIQQAVFRSIAYHSRTIRLPVHVHNLLNRVRKVRSTLQRDLGRPPTNEEMADNLDMTLDKYNKMLRLTKRSISLEMPKYQSNPKDLGHESEDLLVETIDANAGEADESSPEMRVDRGLFQEDLNVMLEVLDDDERRVICARYGLADGLTRTVTAVAAQMNMSKAWVRSRECRALRRLRRPWYEKKLKEHQDALSN